MKKNCARKSARGGRALLTGLMRSGRCGRTKRVFYSTAKGNAHRCQCRGDDALSEPAFASGSGGFRIDRAVALQILEAVSDRVVEARHLRFGSDRAFEQDVIAAVERDLEEARMKHHLRRANTIWWSRQRPRRQRTGGAVEWGAGERVAELERRIADLRATAAASEDRSRAAFPTRPRSAGGMECPF